MFWVSLLDPPANREGENTLSCSPPNGKTIVLCCHCLNMSPLGDKVRSDVLRNTFCKYRLQFSPALKTRASPLSADTYKVGTSVLQLHGTEFLLQHNYPGSRFSPRAYRRDHRSVGTLIPALWGWKQRKHSRHSVPKLLTDRLIINLDCFKLLNLW